MVALGTQVIQILGAGDEVPVHEFHDGGLLRGPAFSFLGTLSAAGCLAYLRGEEYSLIECPCISYDRASSPWRSPCRLILQLQETKQIIQDVSEGRIQIIK